MDYCSWKYSCSEGPTLTRVCVHSSFYFCLFHFIPIFILYPAPCFVSFHFPLHFLLQELTRKSLVSSSFDFSSIFFSYFLFFSSITFYFLLYHHLLFLLILHLLPPFFFQSLSVLTRFFFFFFLSIPLFLPSCSLSRFFFLHSLPLPHSIILVPFPPFILFRVFFILCRPAYSFPSLSPLF